MQFVYDKMCYNCENALKKSKTRLSFYNSGYCVIAVLDHMKVIMHCFVAMKYSDHCK